MHSSPESERSRLRRKLLIAVVALVIAVATVTVLIVLQLFGTPNTVGDGSFEHPAGSAPATGQSADRQGPVAGRMGHLPILNRLTDHEH